MIVIGMIIVSYAFSVNNMDITQGNKSNGSGVIVVLPFPFIVYTSDPTITIIMFIAMLLVPMLLFLWFIKRVSIF